MPEKTAEEFTADGWFKTGDVGRTSDDGYVFAGLLCEPAVPSSVLVLWVHGLHIGFAAPEYVKIARQYAGLPAMVDMAMGHEQFLDRHALLLRRTLEHRQVATRIDKGTPHRLRTPEQGAILLKRRDRDQHGL